MPTTSSLQGSEKVYSAKPAYKKPIEKSLQALAITGVTCVVHVEWKYILKCPALPYFSIIYPQAVYFHCLKYLPCQATCL